MNAKFRACALLAIAITISLQISHQSALADTEKTKKPSEKASKPTLEQMHDKYRNVKTLTADFTQRQTNMALGTTKETSGRIYIKRPNMFRWETLAPEKDESTLVGNGHNVWFYTPPLHAGEHGQVLISRAADVQSRLAIDLLAGHADIKKEFKTKDLGNGRFELTPLKPAGDVDHIELFIERPTNLVYKLVLFNLTGNQTELTLKNVTPGAPIADSSFNFVPPPNTEEIH